ncbi:MAG TPA: Lrp/AsnC ligand binding domain-containing protein, partial [Thermomicrobiales bacterium]|nr:Lrp/AsnC ligand binding domain-containing protein [Thermomicrobiales bacterium]
ITAVITATISGGDYAAFLGRIDAEAAVAECHRITGEANFIVKAHLPDLGSLERLVDDLSKAGAQCAAALVLSSPVPYRPITPPEGTTAPRARATRRRRRASAGDNASEPVKRPGRPRGRRPAGVESVG